MSKRPVIGITCDHRDDKPSYTLPFAYCEAVEKAGGLPLILPYRTDLSLVSHYADLVDGMLFSGGNDLDPAGWGEPLHPRAVPIDPLRERFERALMAEVERRKVPTLGICLGSQLMNVHRGGTLNQFIPDMERGVPIEHRRLGDAWDARHDVIITEGTLLAKAIGERTVRSNTSHKQSIRTVGRGLRVVAEAPDGVVEAVEDPTLPFWLGVQWHPERQHDEAEHLRLFTLLVERASEFRGK
jgi:putative glutamine amidotransferase